jgi:hypothetical protein
MKRRTTSAGEHYLAPVRSQDEVAAIMTARGYPMTGSNIYCTERRVFEKLRRDPVLQRLLREMVWLRERSDAADFERLLTSDEGAA